MATNKLTALDFTSPFGNIITTGLNSLADDDECTAAGVDNSSDLAIQGVLWLSLASIDLSGLDTPYATIRVVHGDGTTQPDAEIGGLLYTAYFDPGSAAATHMSPGVPFLMLPGTTYFSVINKLGSSTAFPSSGNILRLGTYNEASS